MAINEWWLSEPGETYWMETTGRSDIGANLLAPQEDEGGGANNPGYVLVTHVEDGDIVLHWDTNRKALVAWSRAIGGYWKDEIEWASVPGGGTPFLRPAWVHGLEGPFEFAEPIPLADIRAVGAQVGVFHDGLAARHSGSLYFPFTRYGDWANLRTGQPYMSKFPTDLIPIIPGLAEELWGDDPENPPINVVGVPEVEPATEDVGLDYEDVDLNINVSTRDPFEVDPAVVDRGVRGHGETQNDLATWVRKQGHRPLRPGPADPSFDLAWTEGSTLYVSEVKSLTEKNEERQLRLGLGQVLRYRHVLDKAERPAVAVLAIEREPRDGTWKTLCASLGVRLVWPGDFSAL